MDDLFGISMTLIMAVLLALLAVALASIALVAWRNRIMFKMGVRNIPRRRAQTTLIVLGLMLSTVIISAAFTTGDTVDRSITSEVYSLLGSVDEVVLVGSFEDDEEAFDSDDPSQAVVRDQSFSQDLVAPMIQALRSDTRVDAVVPAYADLAVAINPEKRLSSPQFYLQGLDPAAMGDLPDVRNVDGGGRLRVEELAQGEIYIDESASEELDVRAGDAIVIYAHDRATTFRVKAVAEDRRLAGTGGISVRREGGVLPLATVQSMFDAQGRLTQLYVSNAGDARGGLAHSDAVEAQIEAAVAALPQAPDSPALATVPLKRIGVDLAEQGANFFATFFLVLGLFSIGAGVLLVFMIFVMLAAERKPEMGMARAVGTKRGDLVQTFLSEGMAYNVLAAMVGTALGVLVAFGMSQIMARIFQEFDINISPHVTFRSLAISYSLGVVLTFLTVTFSSWRVSHINIVRAVRDIPEPPSPKPRWGTGGVLPTLLTLIFKPQRQAQWERAVATLVFGLVAGGALSATGVDALIILGSVLIAAGALGFFFQAFQLGPVFLIGGLALLISYVAADSTSAFLLLFALSLTPLGLALVLRSFGANERLVYTLCGVFLIYIWEIDFSVGLLERIFGEAEGDIEMFFLSGVMVTVAATFIVVYNADIILAPLTRLGRGLGALLPSIKMAVAYPLANRTRTGLTMAMFCLVVFALTVMSSMNHNFNRLFISDRALGGWDVTVDENPTNPIGDLEARLREVGSPAADAIEAVGVTSLVAQRNARLCQVIVEGDCQPSNIRAFGEYQVRGEDESFLASSRIALQARAAGYDSDADVWRALGNDPSLAIIDAFALPGGGFGESAFTLEGVEADDKEIEPVTLTLMDAATRKTAAIRVIGVIELGSSASYTGLHVSNRTVAAVFGEPDAHRYYVRTVEGADNRQVARDIESALLTTGAQAESLRYQVDKQNATFNGFFYLMQGFMGLGLLVGVAAVGVIAFRTVVERRQQIGMLRALGYTRKMIGLTFLIESAFIAFMGVLSGIVFALILARQLITDEFANQGGTGFVVPWPQVLVIASLAFGFALLMTLIPSRQAARIPIAAALRYE